MVLYPVLRHAQLQQTRGLGGGLQACRIRLSGAGQQQEVREGPLSHLSHADSHKEPQKRLYDASARSMYLHYSREQGSSMWKFFRKLTIDVNYDFRRWKKHQRATRHLQLWTAKNIIHADNIRRLFIPDMLVVFSAAASISYYNHFFGKGEALLYLPMECFSVTSVALGLMVTFKTQTCYSRFDDARFQWGMIINENRGLASRILNRLPTVGGADETRVLRDRLHAVKLIQSFGHTVKYHVTEDGCNPHIEFHPDTPQADINTALTAALHAELETVWDMKIESEAAMVEKILAPDPGNRPILILHELSHINAKVFSDPSRGGLDPITSASIDKSLAVLHHTLGRCERLLRTPIYTPYTKFTSRLLYIWCTTLPLAMYPLLGPVLTPPVTIVISFFLLGIQDIGSRVEQPFDVLPLWQYCQTIDLSIEQMIRRTESDELDDQFDGLEDLMPEHLESWCDPL